VCLTVVLLMFLLVLLSLLQWGIMCQLRTWQQAAAGLWQLLTTLVRVLYPSLGVAHGTLLDGC
jgi:hypothetical protein